MNIKLLKKVAAVVILVIGITPNILPSRFEPSSCQELCLLQGKIPKYSDPGMVGTCECV